MGVVRHAAQVRGHPEQWLPWNYRDNQFARAASLTDQMTGDKSLIASPAERVGLECLLPQVAPASALVPGFCQALLLRQACKSA